MTITTGSPTRSRTAIYVLAWACLVADGYDLMTYGATLPALIGRAPFELTVAQAGHIGSFALVGMLIGSLVTGTLTDVIGRRKLFLVSVAVFSLGMIAAALSPSVELFVTARFVTCLGVGGLLPTAVALASEFTRPETRSRTLGLVLTGPPVGMVLASLLSSQLLAEHGFRPIYAIAGVMLLLLPVLYTQLPESPSYLAARGRLVEAAEIRTRYALPEPVASTDRAPKTPLSGILGRPVLVPTLLIWGTTFFSLLTVFGITTWLPQVMAKSGYGLGSSVTFLLVYCLGAVLGTVVAASIADRIGPKPLVLVGYVSAAVALLLIAQRPATPVLVVLVLIAGFGGFGTQNVLNDFISHFYPAGSRASGLGWALGVGRIGGIVGPTFGAWAVSQAAPLSATATAFATTAVLGAVVMVLIPRSAPVEGTPAEGDPVAQTSQTQGASALAGPAQP